MKEIRLFSKMPLSDVFSSKNWQEKFQEMIKEIYNAEDEVYFKNITNMIWEKLISNNSDDCWSIDDYKDFKRIFSKIKLENIKNLEGCIEKCLMTPNSEIFRELKSLGEQVDWYPFKEKIKVENTNQYCWQETEIQLMDCFRVANSLVAYVHSFINNQAINFIQLFDEFDDVATVLQKLKEDTSIMESLFMEFDNNFRFVAEYPLFESIYFTVKSELLERFISQIYLIYGRENRQKAHPVYLDKGASTYAIRQGYWQKSSEEKYYGKKYLAPRVSHIR